MSARTVKLLALGVVVLFAAVFLMNRNGDDTSTGSSLLLPALKGALNDVVAVTVTSAEGTVTMRNENGRWVVPEKHGYPADTPTLRSLLLALADARTIERKTANPELYEHLGVADPADGEGGGVLVEVSVTDGEEPIAVILGDPAQGDYRYARLPDEEASWLIDRNPAPEGAGEWLQREIVDIPPSRVRMAEIRHADGEVIHISKESAEETNFSVADVPEGRELSYPSVANGIAGVLSNLRLNDVRPAPADAAAPSVTLSLATFGGLRIDMDVWQETGSEQAGDGDAPATWLALEASASEQAEGDSQAARPQAAAPEDSGEASGADIAGEAGATASTGPEAGDGEAGPPAGEAEAETGGVPAEPAAPDPQEQAAAVNERVDGWQYRIPDHKARQLTHRFEDLLKDEDEE